MSADPGSPEQPRSGEAARCPICGRPVLAAYRPFCSRRCADVDLNRWLGGVYAIPAGEGEPDDDLPADGPSG